MLKSTFKILCKPTMQLLVLAFILVFTTQSCKKENDTKVIYSDWFTPNSYIKDTVFGIWGFKYNQVAPDITQEILDKGTVITYGKLLGYSASVWPGEQVAQLPITVSYIQSGVTNDTWSALATVGNLKIRFVNDRNIYTSISNAHQFRYIIIPGKAKANNSAIAGTETLNPATPLADADPDIKYVADHYSQMNYTEVCNRLHIPQ